jgi:hypothetical protein
MKKLISLFILALFLDFHAYAQPSKYVMDSVKRAMDSLYKISELDHQNMMDQLHIKTLRPGANSKDPNAPNAPNYDETKANPYPDLPDPLVLKNGVRVTTPEMWWNKRRPEIVEDFDREIYGRVPENTPNEGFGRNRTSDYQNFSRSCR